MRGAGGKISGARIKYCHPIDTLQVSWGSVVSSVDIIPVHVIVLEVTSSQATCAWLALITCAGTIGETTAKITVFSRVAGLREGDIFAIYRSVAPDVTVRAIVRRVSVIPTSTSTLLIASGAIILTLVEVVTVITTRRA